MVECILVCHIPCCHTVQTDRSSINAKMQSEMESKMGTRNQPKAFKNQVAEIQVPGSSLCTLTLKPRKLFKGKSNAALKVLHVNTLTRSEDSQAALMKASRAVVVGSSFSSFYKWSWSFHLIIYKRLTWCVHPSLPVYPAPKVHVKHGQLPVICGALNVSGSNQQHCLGTQSNLSQCERSHVVIDTNKMWNQAAVMLTGAV